MLELLRQCLTNRELLAIKGCHNEALTYNNEMKLYNVLCEAQLVILCDNCMGRCGDWDAHKVYQKQQDIQAITMKIVHTGDRHAHKPMGSHWTGNQLNYFPKPTYLPTPNTPSLSNPRMEQKRKRILPNSC